MPEYILELKVKRDSIQRGVREGTTFRVNPSAKPKDHVSTWSFSTSAAFATVTTDLETAVAALAAVAYAG